MSQATAQAAQPGDSAAEQERYTHEAFVWHGEEAFLGRTVPFVLDALAAGQPVLVAVTRTNEQILRQALGPAADSVEFLEVEQLGRNPARIIPAWIAFIEKHRAAGTPLRGVIEPVWAGRRDEELAECLMHEAMLDLAVPRDAPLALLCPYDADALDPAVLDEALRVHPAPGDPTSSAGTPTGPREDVVRSLYSVPLPEPRGETEDLEVGHGRLAAVRSLVSRHGAAAGLSHDRIADLRLAVTEVAANSVDHGGGSGTLRAWQEPGALIFEVRDAGRLHNLLVGRLAPTVEQPRGRGLWIVNQLCDLMQIRTIPDGIVVRVVTWL